MNNLSEQAAATPLEDSTTRLIPLTQGQFAIVDAADFDWLNQWKWCASFSKSDGGWRALRGQRIGGKNKIIMMHRVIMGNPEGMEIDHKDHNTLNNRRSNLRVATHRQNAFNRHRQKNNSSGFKGVYWDKSVGLWKARINGVYVGCFHTPEEADRAYREAAIKHHGEFRIQ